MQDFPKTVLMFFLFQRGIAFEHGYYDWRGYIVRAQVEDLIRCLKQVRFRGIVDAFQNLFLANPFLRHFQDLRGRWRYRNDFGSDHLRKFATMGSFKAGNSPADGLRALGLRGLISGL